MISFVALFFFAFLVALQCSAAPASTELAVPFAIDAYTAAHYKGEHWASGTMVAILGASGKGCACGNLPHNEKIKGKNVNLNDRMRSFVFKPGDPDPNKLTINWFKNADCKDRLTTKNPKEYRGMQYVDAIPSVLFPASSYHICRS
ncbi:hypothetical protein BJ138DRAFT_570250 [Hygrophoropsis aurantiaca]|uniref:Uncharacterized protein n=1 Tax=Hygrophoropsis aurantiaca TaxID=72124 RepID=A0ACB8AKB3_9AGAM|nr:hypothetical protein BJ138DRAFT_570250 [Hygrophoropsis aurantiaca]